MDNQTILNWIIIIAIILFFIISRNYKNKVEENNEIKNNPKIYLTEKYIGIDKPIPLQGYPDRVVWENSKLVIEDKKTRNYNKVFETDIIQLSVYKYILKRVQKDGEVSEKAKIYIKNGNKEIIKYIDLLSDEKIESLYKRYIDLENKDILPRKINNINYCKKCPFYNKYCFPDMSKRK